MHQIVDQLNSKLLALTAQLGALRSDIDGLESEFIELSKELSDLSAQLEAEASETVEDTLEVDVLTWIDVRNLGLSEDWLLTYGYKPRRARVKSPVIDVWVKV